MKKMFDLLDVSQEGRIDRQQFEHTILNNERLCTILESMDLEVHDLKLLFEFIDNGDGEVTMTEFMCGIQRLRGNARSIDLCAMSYSLAAIGQQLTEIQRHVGIG